MCRGAARTFFQRVCAAGQANAQCVLVGQPPIVRRLAFCHLFKSAVLRWARVRVRVRVRVHVPVCAWSSQGLMQGVGGQHVGTYASRCASVRRPSSCCFTMFVRRMRPRVPKSVSRSSASVTRSMLCCTTAMASLQNRSHSAKKSLLRTTSSRSIAFAAEATCTTQCSRTRRRRERGSAPRREHGTHASRRS